MNNPLKYTDPSGYTVVPRDYEGEYLLQVGNSLTARAWDMTYGLTNTGSGGFGGPGYGMNGTGLNGRYYDWYSDTYRSTSAGNPSVNWDDVFVNAIEPNTEFLIYQDFTSFKHNNKTYEHASGRFHIIRGNRGMTSDGTYPLFNTKTEAESYIEDVLAIPHFENLGGTAITIRNTANAVSLTASGVATALQSTKLGSDIAYFFSNSKTFLQATKYLKPLANKAAIVSMIADGYLTLTGQQSLTETGINTAVTISAMIMGGPYGLALIIGYNFGKEGMEMIQEGLNEGILKPNPSPTSNYIPGLAPAFVIPNW